MNEENSALYLACQSQDIPTQTAAFQAVWSYLYRVALKLVYDQPNAADVAQDCAQRALIRVHERLAECQEPAAFRAWARQIVSHLAIDYLRQQKRLLPLEDEESETAVSLPAPTPTPEDQTITTLTTHELYTHIAQAPISDRSRRVVIGRYRDDLPDEHLAQRESQLTNQTVLPSHIQVTRAKNIAKLRNYEPLRQFLEVATE